MNRSIAIGRESVPRGRLALQERLARRMVLASLGRFREGRLTILEEGGVVTVGDPGASDHATIRVNDARAYIAMAFGGSVGAGEAYMDGLWEAELDDLTLLISLMVRNRDALMSMDGRLAALTGPLRRLAYFSQRNTLPGSRRNIAAHYNLSNDLFRLFLDPSMTYSCAIFEHGADTLEQASVEKIDRACRKLELRPSDHLLEIGTGWGSMAMHAARHYGCRVTTTTISSEQAALARERIAEAGLGQRIEVLERDYRRLEGCYDKLVSIEMIEAVGRRYLDGFFATCSRLLAPDGLALIQAITIRDQFDAAAARNRDWLKKYIFPGSCLLSIQAMQRSITRATDMRILGLEDIGPHYARTLRHWRDAFNGRLEEVRALGFDDRFVRMWNYYLCYCRGVFAERQCSAVQLLAAKPRNRREPVADRGPGVPLEAIAPR